MRACCCASVKYFAHADARWHKLDEEEWSMSTSPQALTLTLTLTLTLALALNPTRCAGIRPPISPLYLAGVEHDAAATRQAARL